MRRAGVLPRSFLTAGGVILLTLAAASSAWAGTDSSAETWVLSAATAPDQISFTGTQDVTVWAESGAQSSTVDIVHLAPEAYRLTYRSTIGRPERIVIDDGRQRWQYEPSLSLVLIGPSLTEEEEPLSARRLGLLRANYDVRLAGQEAIAGRPAVILVLRPRAGARPWLKVWGDQASGLILRSERYYAEGGLAEAAAFTRIAMGPPDEALLRFHPPAGVTVREASVSRPVAPADLKAKVGFVPLTPQRLPEGFVLDRIRVTDWSPPAAVIQYTDGLATLTLFQRRAAPGARSTFPAARRIALGGGSAELQVVHGATVLRWQTRGIEMTLLGDLPLQELTQIAAGIGVEPSRTAFAGLRYWLALLWQHVAAR